MTISEVLIMVLCMLIGISVIDIFYYITKRNSPIRSIATSRMNSKAVGVIGKINFIFSIIGFVFFLALLLYILFE